MPVERVKASPSTILALKIANTLLAIAVFTVNSLAGATTLIGGSQTGQISDKYETFITPAGNAFTVWGLIYAFLAVFTIYQWLPKANQSLLFDGISFWWPLNAVLNVIWIFLFGYEQLIASFVIISLMWLTLAVIYYRMGRYYQEMTLVQYWCVHFPFTIYFAWLTAATVLNGYLAFAPAEDNGNDSDRAHLSVIGLSVIGVISTTMTGLLKRRDIAFSAIVIWALSWIAIKKHDVPWVYTACFYFIGWLCGLEVVAIYHRLQPWFAKRIHASQA